MRVFNINYLGDGNTSVQSVQSKFTDVLSNVVSGDVCDDCELWAHYFCFLVMSGYVITRVYIIIATMSISLSLYTVIPSVAHESIACYCSASVTLFATK